MPHAGLEEHKANSSRTIQADDIHSFEEYRDSDSQGPMLTVTLQLGLNWAHDSTRLHADQRDASSD